MQTVCLQAAGQILAVYYLVQHVNSTTDWATSPQDSGTVLMRLICGMMFHVHLESDLIQGYANMKFSSNHPWKFERPSLAFMIGLTQVSLAVVLEVASFFALLAYQTVFEVCMASLTLVLIHSFGYFLYQAYPDNKLKKVVTSGMYSDFLIVNYSDRC